VPAAYEFVEVEGRPGIVFERVEGPSLLEHAQARPWTLFEAVRLLAELHAQIHRCVAPVELPSQREWSAGDIDAVADLSATEKEAARRCLAELPDGTALCHGDFHPGNVLITPRGPVIIDWETATRGHPLGDVACTSD
jgi:aminoglycoside phosphotransferase (APT) family kinase protein